MEKNALVFGASKGVGYEIAYELAKEKWSVVAVGHNKKRLKAAKERAEQEKLDIVFELADIRNDEDVQGLFKRMDYLNSLDLYINCVGSNLSKLLVKKTADGKIITHDTDSFQRIIDLNLIGCFIGTKEAAAFMIKKESKGVLINMSSAVYRGAYGQCAYTASKAAIVAMTRTWGLELSKYGISSISIAPGPIEGESLKKACEINERHKAYMENLKEQIPMKRFITEREIARAVLYLSSNDYFTGTVINIDGGGLPAKVFQTKE